MKEKTEMKQKTMIILMVIGSVIVIVGGAGLALWRDNNAPAPTDDHVHFDDPRGADPEVAATAAMTGLLTWTPAHQAGPWEAASAIAPQLTGQLAAYAASDNGNGEPLPKNWQAWASAGDRVQGLAVVSEDNKDTGERASVATVTVDVEQRVWHPDGDMTPLTKGTVDVTVELVDGVWKAAEYSYLSVEY
jgi:hypothetical protein